MTDNIVDEIRENAIDPDDEPLSACCGSPNAHSDYDICSTCKEHTHFVVECQICKGTGTIEINEHQNEDCPVCEDGYIEV